MNERVFIAEVALKSIHWLSTENVKETLLYVGGLLLAPEVLLQVLGPNLADKMMRILDRMREKLAPTNAKDLARRLTVGPVAKIGILVAAGFFVWAVVVVFSAKTWRTVAGDHPHLFAEIWASLWIILLRPLIPLGFAFAFYAASSEKLTERIRGSWGRIRQFSVEGGPKATLYRLAWLLCVAPIGGLVEAYFTIGFELGTSIVKFAFGGLRALFRSIGFLIERKRMRRIIASVGFGMITAAFILSLKS
jgi:hypothetical protein